LTHRGVDEQFMDNALWLERLQWLRSPGDEIVLPPEGDVDVARAGLYVVTGYDVAKVEQRLAQTAAHITVTTLAAGELS
ncbi:carboxylase, partial [Streptomyces sp. NPDC048551]